MIDRPAVPSRRPRTAVALTLIELLLGSALLAFVTLTLFALLRGSLRGGSRALEAQRASLLLARVSDALVARGSRTLLETTGESSADSDDGMPFDLSLPGESSGVSTGESDGLHLDGTLYSCRIRVDEPVPDLARVVITITWTSAVGAATAGGGSCVSGLRYIGPRSRSYVSEITGGSR